MNIDSATIKRGKIEAIFANRFFAEKAGVFAKALIAVEQRKYYCSGWLHISKSRPEYLRFAKSVIPFYQPVNRLSSLRTTMDANITIVTLWYIASRNLLGHGRKIAVRQPIMPNKPHLVIVEANIT